jgi:MFS family permease
MSGAASAERVAARAWMVVGLLWVVALLNYLDRIMLTSMRDSLREAIPMDNGQFGLLMTAFLWVYAVLSPLGGYLADRFGRSPVIVASLLVWSAVTWWTTTAHTFSDLLIARSLMGISEACYLPAALALIADYHRGPTRSMATALHMTGLYVGSALGGVGGTLADHFGWKSGFFLFGAVGVCYAVVLALLLRDPVRPPQPAASAEKADERLKMSAAVAALVRQPSFLVLVAVFSAFSFVNWSVLTWLPTYLRETFALGQGRAGLMASIPNQAGSLVGILIGGYVSDRWSRSNLRARLLVPMVGICFAGPCLFCSAVAGFLPAVLVGVALYGLGKSATDANWMPILCQISDRRSRATGYGIMNLCSCLTGGVAAWASGALKDAHFGLASTLQVLGVIFFATGWLFLFIRPRNAVEE